MKTQICICRESQSEQAELKALVENYFNQRHIDHKIACYDFGVVLLEDFIDDIYTPDILLIDVHLPKSNGVDICKEMRKLRFNGIILFVTDDPSHAVKGYDVDARGYIVKPYDTEKIYATFDRILSNSDMRSYYVLKSHHRIIKILKSQILYAESIKNQCVIHCKEDIDYTFYKKLSELERELDDNHFLRCHQSYLINMDYVTSADECFVLDEKIKVPVRKHEVGKIKKSYYDFIRS